MVPWSCDICGDWTSGDYLQFNVTDPEELKYNEWCLKEPRLEGHPSGSIYFCHNHLEVAKKYCHLTYQNEARALILAEVQG